MKVGVKFCGGCNPYVDTQAVLGSLVSQAPDLEFVHWEEPDCEVLLILNACPVGCSSRPSFLGPQVIVASDAVNYWPVGETELLPRILRALRESGMNDGKKS
jgi:hypothetical protein